jgi:hypothetical protein
MDNIMQPTMAVDQYGDKIWKLNGQYHREDGPAFEFVNGFKSWFLHGHCHRTDGPATEWQDGASEWWLYGNKLTLDQWLEANTAISDEEKVMLKLQYG